MKEEEVSSDTTRGNLRHYASHQRWSQHIIRNYKTFAKDSSIRIARTNAVYFPFVD